MRELACRPVSLAAVPILAIAAGLIFGSIVTGAVVLATAAFAWWAARVAIGSSGIRRILWGVLGGLATVAVVIQFVPYGHDHTNPAVGVEPSWDTPETRALAVRACFDCHSNETAWPWYTDVAPVSWLATNHVIEGRAVLDFSNWDRPQHEVDESAETIREGEMPPRYYTILHSGARLSDAVQQQLIDGLEATLRSSPPG